MYKRAHKSERLLDQDKWSAKPRQRSPVCTSSEDEGKILQPRKRPSPPRPTHRTNLCRRGHSAITVRPARRTHQRTTMLPSACCVDRSIRIIWGSLPRSWRRSANSRRCCGDSDAEMDAMDPDDLMKLSMKHKSLKKGLHSYQGDDDCRRYRTQQRSTSTF